MNKGESLNKFMQIMRSDMNVIEATLQTEESGNKIASLQGECSGYRSLCKELESCGWPNYAERKETMQTLFKYDSEYEKWTCTTSNYATLLEWETYALDVEEALDEARGKMDKRLNDRKDWLFYRAKKGRDLYFSRGWYKRFIALGEWAVAIHDAFQAAKKIHDAELQFDEEA